MTIHMTIQEVASNYVGLHLYGRGRRGTNRAVAIKGYLFLSNNTPIAIYNRGKFHLATSVESGASKRHIDELRKEIYRENYGILEEYGTFGEIVEKLGLSGSQVLENLFAGSDVFTT